jgi:hypothetical protein
MRKLWPFLMLLPVVFPAPASAEGTVGAMLPRVDGAKACFSRVYDSGHLASHKDQRVTQIGFRLAFVAERNDDGSIYESYRYQLTARLHGQAKAATASGECGEFDGRSFCGVECDGGGVYVVPRPDGSLLVEFGDSRGIRMTAGCGDDEDDFVMLEPGKDDKAFRLSRVPDDQCPAYAGW